MQAEFRPRYRNWVRGLTNLWARQEVRYLLSGGVNTLFGYGVYALFNWLLTPHLPFGYMAAAVLSNVVAITFSFLTYKFFVFRTRGNYLREYLRCYLVYGGTALLGLALLPLLVEVCGVNSYLAPIVGFPLIVLASYLGHKHFSFRPKAGERGEPATPGPVAPPAAGDSRPPCDRPTPALAAEGRAPATAGPVGNRWFSRPVQWSVVAALLLLYWFMAVSATREKCTAYDELPHLTAGYSQLITRDYRLLPGQGSLPEKWAALPLLFLHPALPQTARNPDWVETAEFKFGHSFFYRLGNDPAMLLLAGRMMIGLLGAALVLAVFLWSRQIWGTAGGFVSLILAVFCPALLAHGALVTCDLAHALFLLLSVWQYWQLLDSPSWRRVLTCSLAFAGLCLAKASWVLVLPMLALLFLVRLLLPPAGRPATPSPSPLRDAGRLLGLSLACGVVVAALIWAWYGFRFAAAVVPPGGVNPLAAGWDACLKQPSLAVAAVGLARDLHLLPEAWLYGVVSTVGLINQKSAFLNGECSMTGFRTFFPYAFLVKTPLALFGLLLLALCTAGARLRPTVTSAAADRWAGLRPTLPLWVLLVVYWAAAVRSPMNIGHRHILVTYPALYVLAGASAGWLTRKRPLLLAGTALFVLMFITESLIARPHYLAYFNPLAGGSRNGYRHLVDSSLDWGQDLPGLRRWLAAHRQPGEPVYLAYFGVGEPEHHGITAVRMPFSDRTGATTFGPLTGGLYCISATRLQSAYTSSPGPWNVRYEETYHRLRRELTGTPVPGATSPVPDDVRQLMAMVFDELRLNRLCSSLRRREPDAQVGYSILIYRLSDTQVQAALDGPPVELLPDIRVRDFEP